MKPMKKVAQKTGFTSGLVLVAALGLTSCPAADSSPAPAKVSSMPTSLTMTVPDSGWRLGVERVVELDAEVWVLAQLHREPGPAAQMIRKIEAAIPVALPAKRLRVFVAGKTWAWRNEEAYEFVASLKEVAQRAGAARVLFPVRAK